jgi:hypothetical protein
METNKHMHTNKGKRQNKATCVIQTIIKFNTYNRASHYAARKNVYTYMYIHIEYK